LEYPILQTTKTPEEQKELEQLKQKLLQEYTEEELQTNLDVVIDALETSKLPEGLGVPIQSYAPDVSSNVRYENPQPMVNNHTNVLSQRTIMRAERDPVEIFKIFLGVKQRELEQQKQAYDKLVDDARTAWYYYQLRTPANERYSAYLGRYIDESYFLENLYPCPYDMTKRCTVRYKSPADYQRHYHF
jgi:hypothetical protein